MKRLILPALLLAVVLVCSVGIALATPGSNIISANLSLGRFDRFEVKTRTEEHKVQIKTRGFSDVYVVSNRFPPGAHSGWHTHPGPSLITVKAGTITAYSGDDPACTPTQYAAGTGFIDPGGDSVHLLRNEGSVEAETVAVQILPAGADRRIDAPSPGTCPF
jgi:quercetin dioxygenase-like cupin family protein